MEPSLQIVTRRVKSSDTMHLTTSSPVLSLLQELLFPRNLPVSFRTTSESPTASPWFRGKPGSPWHGTLQSGPRWPTVHHILILTYILIHPSLCHPSWSGGRISSSKKIFQICWLPSLFHVSATRSRNAAGSTSQQFRFLKTVAAEFQPYPMKNAIASFYRVTIAMQMSCFYSHYE